MIGLSSPLAAAVDRARRAAPTRLHAAAALAAVDLTTLSDTDTDPVVERLCARALAPAPGLAPVAAVCVFPVFVPTARRALGASPVALASVAGAFPHGQSPLALRVAEVRRAIDDGADEIDMVISRGRLLAGEDAFVHDEVAAHVEAAGRAPVKVILETGELGTAEAIARASRLALDAGAAFLKTSTGKAQPGATPEAFAVMADAIRAHRERTGRAIGLKAAGGVRTLAEAVPYLVLAEDLLGPDAVDPARLRIGASSLLDDLVSALR